MYDRPLHFTNLHPPQHEAEASYAMNAKLIEQQLSKDRPVAVKRTPVEKEGDKKRQKGTLLDQSY